MCQAYFSSICVNPNKSADKVINWVSAQDLAPVQEIKGDFSCSRFALFYKWIFSQGSSTSFPLFLLTEIMLSKCLFQLWLEPVFPLEKKALCSLGNGNPYEFHSKIKPYRAFNYSCILLLHRWSE